MARTKSAGTGTSKTSKTSARTTTKSGAARTAKPAVKSAAKSATKPAAKPAGAVRKLPALSLAGLKGETKLGGMKGKKTVLYFYPKDDTSGCTKEACAFQENLAAFKKAGANVIGVSKDDLASHEKFARKYGLAFDLLADTDLKLATALGVWVEKSMYGRKYMGMDRATFVIDGKGQITAEWRKVKVPGHADEVLAFVKSMKG